MNIKFWNIDNFDDATTEYNLKKRINQKVEVSGLDHTGKCTYIYNELGFRGDSPQKKGFKIMSIGCSNTEGIGLNNEQTWPHLFSKSISNGVNLNFGCGGRSNDYISRALITYFPIIKPDLVLIMYTDQHRRDFFTKTNKLAPFHYLPWGYFSSSKDGQENHEAMVKLSNPINDLQNWYRNHLLIKTYLELNKCNFLWNGWALHNTDITDEFRFDGKFYPFVDVAVDNTHPGIITSERYVKSLKEHIELKFPQFLPKNEYKTMDNNENPYYIKVKNELNSVGCGMCLAKWTQVTLQLQSGHNHSCHHPGTHKISMDEIKRNPSALHNTRFKKILRKEMLDGLRPAECDYCWNVEDTSERFSDRIFKSSESWSYPFIEEIKKSEWRDDYNPKYVEVSFSNACNFKCSYCGPAYSTKWMEEIKKFGEYPTLTRFNSLDTLKQENKEIIGVNEENPYVEAFWKWWPNLYRDLHTFRITGGEPLLSKDTWGVLDYIIEQETPNKELNFAINSNLGVSDVLIDKLISKIKKIEDENRVKEFVIFTSIDTWGEDAEYIRYGLEFNRFWNNVNKILEQCPRVIITVMSTYNALSIFNYNKLIVGIHDLKEKYNSSDRYMASAVFLDTSYLRHPQHQSVKILPSEFNKNVLSNVKLMDYYMSPLFNHNEIGYSDIEIQKIKRIYDWMITPEDFVKLKHNRYDFYRFITEHDKRRGTNFVKTFPELEQFYNQCKSIKI